MISSACLRLLRSIETPRSRIGLPSPLNSIVRPLIAGRLPEALALHVAVLLGYAAAGYFIAIRFARKRFAE